METESEVKPEFVRKLPRSKSLSKSRLEQSNTNGSCSAPSIAQVNRNNGSVLRFHIPEEESPLPEAHSDVIIPTTTSRSRRSVRRSVSRALSFKELSERLHHSTSLRKESSTSAVKAERKKEKSAPPSKGLKIGPVIATTHIKHVDQQDANEFLTRMIKMRDEKYAHLHHEIRAGTTEGFIFLRPSSSHLPEFRQIMSSSPIKKEALPVDKHKYTRFWFKLQPISQRQAMQNNEGSWIFVSGASAHTVWRNSISRTNSRPQRTLNAVQDAVDLTRLQYFPNNVHALRPPSDLAVPEGNDWHAKHRRRVENAIPDGPPRYALTFYVSRQKTDAEQMLGVIPLEDVKIFLLSPLELSVNYVNRTADTHYFRFSSTEETNQWVQTFQRVTQENVKKITRTAPSISFSRLTDSVRDLKKAASGSNVADEATPTAVNKRSYLPIFWDPAEIQTDSMGCFSPQMQLEEYFDNSEGDTVRQGWRMQGGTIPDLVLWCLISSQRSGLDNIDWLALLISQPWKTLLASLQMTMEQLKQATKEKATKERGMLLSKSRSIFSRSESNVFESLKVRLFHMTEQWLKFIHRVALEEYGDESTPLIIRSAILDFCQPYLRRDHMMILRGLTQNQETPSKMLQPLSFPASASIQAIWQTDSTIQSVLDVKARLLAEQLTLWEAEFHSRVRHSELFEMQWEKRPEQAPNVNAMTDHFNRVSLWVATQIAREESPKQQAKVVAKFIKVVEHLMAIRNYNSAVQIMSGLSNVAIQRLKRLQKNLDPKTLTSIELIGDKFDPASGYANYRKLPFEAPCLHLYAVPLRTLTLIEEGNPHFLKEGSDLICFSRLTMIAECMEMLHLQEAEYTDYSFETDPEVMEWLQQMRPLTEEQLYEMSLEHEPLRNRLAVTERARSSDDFDSELSLQNKTMNPLWGKGVKDFMRSGKEYVPAALELLPRTSSDAAMRDRVSPISPRRQGKIKRRSSALFSKITPRIFADKDT